MEWHYGIVISPNEVIYPITQGTTKSTRIGSSINMRYWLLNVHTTMRREWFTGAATD